MIFIIIAIVFVVALCVLYIHKIGVANMLRFIGVVFIGSGDSVDYWKSSVAKLAVEQRSRPTVTA